VNENFKKSRLAQYLSRPTFEANYCKLLRGLYLLVFLTAFGGLHDSVWAQDVAIVGDDSKAAETNLLVYNQILSDSGRPMSDVIIRLLEGTVTVKLDTSDSAGYFSHTIPFEGLYKLTFEFPGFVRKSIEFDTRNMPEEDKQFGYDAGKFKVRMMRPTAELPLGLYQEPMARFIYDSRYRIFVLDKAYRKERKEKFKQLKEKEHAPIKF
jgi:hypothetical protein